VARIEELGRQGMFCSQILLTLVLELRGEENPQLVGSVEALAGGMGFSGRTCGCLTGGACALGAYAGRGTVDSAPDLRLNDMVVDLVQWFEERFGAEGGSTRCDDILQASVDDPASPCPAIIAETFIRVKELLIEEGIDLRGGS
jgi:hypothetical protein